MIEHEKSQFNKIMITERVLSGWLKQSIFRHNFASVFVFFLVYL